jgi:nucleotide-binding universal stress UspA family protein
MYERILVPLDGTACSEAALPHALALADKFGSELILLRVVEPISLPPPPPNEIGILTPAPLPLPEMEEEQEAAATEYIKDLSSRIRAQGGVVTDVEWGGTVDQIVQCAASHHADLIVMGTHGRHGWERLLLGSTSESLLHHTDVPVLLVKHHAAH